ncbi:TRAP transporter large permease subunit [uncultured Tateyamaria sp.]|uniref:TRAP transporter large permease subunit n=1 Tax=uncultured Tateyamaria sp. TaxID=455651 RepID=UPI0026036B38|nr:TRAP transporter large permease subunit [uncultured Tateyamaria sp.]
MDPLLFGAVIFLGVLLLVAIRVPVAIAMSTVAIIGLFQVSTTPFVLTTVSNLPYAVSSNYSFVVVPMFMLMGALTAATGISSELYTAAHRWTSGIRGSLYYATTLAAGGFGAINGSTVVSSVLFSKIALPEMSKHGYSIPLSAGCICAAGTFAALIPPSIAMVIYAILTNESVGQLLIAGLVPGLLTIFVYVIGRGGPRFSTNLQPV